MDILRDENNFRGTTLITAKATVTLQGSNKPPAMVTGQAVAAYCTFSHSAPEPEFPLLPYRPHSNGGSLQRFMDGMFSISAFGV